jgi:hypothetical protein
VRVPELEWAAQTIPHYDYLLESPEPAAVLAGWHCIPVRVPQAARMVWHKFYSSAKRQDSAKAAKDRRQGIILAAAVTESEPTALGQAFKDAPSTMVAPIKRLVVELVSELPGHQSAAEIIRDCLSAPSRGKPPARR